MEVDNEVSGNGNSYTTEFRQYDPRLGRWKSLDPLMMMFPHMSPYCAFDNNPVFYVDPYGLSSQVKGNGGDDGKDREKIKRFSKWERFKNFFSGKWIKNVVNETAVEYDAIHAEYNAEYNQVAIIRDNDDGEEELLFVGLRLIGSGKDPAEFKGSKYRDDDGNFEFRDDGAGMGRASRFADYSFDKDGDFIVNWSNFKFENNDRTKFNQFADLVLAVITFSRAPNSKTPVSVPLSSRVKSILKAKPKGYTVANSKFDYFFGRVKTGSEHNIRRSAQNKSDLGELGIRNKNQLIRTFNEALVKGEVMKTTTNAHGTGVVRRVSRGSGAVDVTFFYEGGDMKSTPKVTTLIPKL